MKVYNEPLYYEIAFSFVSPKRQVDLFEQFIKKYSKIKARRYLDIACGPALQLRELARRGRKCVGLDLNSSMIKYLKEKSRKDKLKIDAICGDMTKFKLKKR